MADFEYQQATALAYSIKLHNKDASVSLLTNYTDRIPHHFHDVFDYLIELPYGSNDVTATNEWQIYWATPYVHTMVINCASLVKENHSSLWNYLIDQVDICFFTEASNFKGAPLVNKRATAFEKNYNFKNVYSSMYYFSILNTIVLYDEPNIHNNLVDIVSMPVALADGDIGMWDKWTDCLNTWVSKGAKVKIQNFAISTNLYYGEQEFLTQEIFDEHRNTYIATSKK